MCAAGALQACSQMTFAERYPLTVPIPTISVVGKSPFMVVAEYPHHLPLTLKVVTTPPSGVV